MKVLRGAGLVFKRRKYPIKCRISSPTVSCLPCCHTPADFLHDKEKQLSQVWHPCPFFWHLNRQTPSPSPCSLSGTRAVLGQQQTLAHRVTVQVGNAQKHLLHESHPPKALHRWYPASLRELQEINAAKATGLQ